MVSEPDPREAPLRRAERIAAVGVLAARIAHDVRNPLFAISATLDAFEARFGSRPELERYLATLREQADRLERLMKDLIECAPPLTPVLEPQDPFALVERALSCCAPDAAAAGVELRNRLGRDLGPIPADAAQIEMALEFVLGHAIRRSAPGSAVEVEARAEDDEDRTLLRIEVRDSGPPIPESAAPRLFDPLCTGAEGGLELSIARRVLESHHGDIRLGNGTSPGGVAVLRLPRDGG